MPLVGEKPHCVSVALYSILINTTKTVAMDSLPFRLVEPTTKLLTRTVLRSAKFGISATKCIARCGASDNVPHISVLEHLGLLLAAAPPTSLNDERVSHKEGPAAPAAYSLGLNEQDLAALRRSMKPSVATFRAMIQAVEKFPDAVGSVASSSSSGSLATPVADRYKQAKQRCVDDLVHRTLALEETGELTPLAALGVAAVMRKPSDSQQFLNAASERLASSPSASDLAVVDIGDSALNVLHNLEPIMRSPHAEALLGRLNVEGAMHTVFRALSSKDAQGQRTTDVALCLLMALMAKHKAWDSAAVGCGTTAAWEAVLDNLLLHREEETHGAAAAAVARPSPFCSVFEAPVVFPAMLAVMRPEAPLVVQERLLQTIGRDLFTLVTHLHPLNALSSFLDASLVQPASTDQRIVLCHLLDAAFLDAVAEQERHMLPQEGPQLLPHHHNRVSLAIERNPLGHIEGYLLTRALLQRNIQSDTTITESQVPSLECPQRALDMIVANFTDMLTKLSAGDRVLLSPGSSVAAKLSCITLSLEACPALRLSARDSSLLLQCLVAVQQQQQASIPVVTSSYHRPLLGDVLDARSASSILLHPALLLRSATGSSDCAAFIDVCTVALQSGYSGFTRAAVADMLAAKTSNSVLASAPAAFHAALAEALHDLPQR